MKRVLTRRQVLAGTAVGLAATALQAQPPKPTAALPRRILGRTGVSVPILGFGSGSRFTNFYTDDAGEAAVRQALDIDRATQENTAFVERITDATQLLAQQAHTLRSAVNVFE